MRDIGSAPSWHEAIFFVAPQSIGAHLKTKKRLRRAAQVAGITLKNPFSPLGFTTIC
jgi:hypothetical protein